MSYRLFRVAGVLSLAVWLLSTPLAFAAGNEAKPADEPPPAAEEPEKEPQKIDEFTEAERAVTRPANNPECVWLGRSVVNLLWRDDLDTALRNLDFYDRLGCPSRHIQASFRCLILHGSNSSQGVGGHATVRGWTPIKRLARQACILEHGDHSEYPAFLTRRPLDRSA